MLNSRFSITLFSILFFIAFILCGLFLIERTAIVDRRRPPQKIYVGEWGFIDKTGEINIKPRFDSAAMFKNGFANEALTANGSSHMTIIDKNATPITSMTFEKTYEMSKFGAVVQLLNTLDKSNQRWIQEQTFIKSDGALFKCRYRECGTFSDGVAVASLPMGPLDFPTAEKMMAQYGYIGKYVLIDSTGNIQKSLPGGAVSMNFSEGLIPLKVKTKTSYMDKKGNIAITPSFCVARDFHDGLACVCLTDGGNWGFIDHSGQFIIPCIFDGPGEFHEGMAIAHTKTESGYIDKKGSFVFKDNKHWRASGNFSEGYAAVALDHGRGGGFIDKSGKLVIELPMCEVNDFHEGLCKVKNQSLYGFINKSGAWQIKPKFADASDFSEGLAAVRPQK
jgi:hypothetical protein